MKLGRFVQEGGCIPPGYEVAYRCWDRVGCMCYPIPFNWLVRVGRWFTLQMRPEMGKTDEIGQAAWQTGRNIAKLHMQIEYERGFNAGRHHEQQIQIDAIDRLLGRNKDVV